MTKATWSSILLLTVGVLSIPYFGGIAPNRHQAHLFQQQTPAPPPPLLADGAINPSAVPDLIAYEILLTSVAEAGAAEVDGLRARLLAEKTKLPADKIELLKVAANTYRANVKRLDAQAAEIKERHRPNPAQTAAAQLGELQRQKEAMLSGIISSFLGKLNNDEKEKLNKRLLEIKKNVKVYAN